MEKRKAVMVDIETLDVKAGGVVLSIGLVFFDPDGDNDFDELVDKGKHIKLNADEQIRKGYDVSADTIAWWIRQAGAAKAALFSTEGSIYLRSAMRDLDVIGKVHDEIWTFGYMDIAMLNYMGRKELGKDVFHYRSHRDLRTYMAGYDEVVSSCYENKPENMVAHNAIHDAAFQAMIVQDINAARRS